MFEIFMTLAFISPFVYYIYHKNEVSKITSEFEEGLIALEAIHKIKRATKKEIKKYKKEIDTMKNLGIEKGPSGRKFDDYLESIEEQNEITDLTEEELKNVFEIVSTELDDESIAEMDGESYTFEEFLEKYNEEGKGFKEVLQDFASASDAEFHEDGDDEGRIDVYQEEKKNDHIYKIGNKEYKDQKEYKNELKKIYPRAYTNWSKEEESKLQKLAFTEKKSIEEISTIMGRQPSAIESRIDKIKNLHNKSSNKKKAYKAPNKTNSISINNKETLCILDLETTGFRPQDSEIVEIFILKVKDNEIIDEFYSMFKPNGKITNSHIHGITNSKVKNSPTIEESNDEIINFLGNSILVGHNLDNFDLKFLNYHLSKTLDNKTLDTLKISRKVLGDKVENHKLDTLANYFGVNPPTHQARDDVMATFEIYKKLLSIQ